MASTVYRLYRILDANFNRSREAARVLEEFARFQLDHAGLAGRCKAVRHRLAECARDYEEAAGILLADSRDTVGDVGTKISVETEASREDVGDVVIANLKRLQESLRSIEEYGKLISAPVSAGIEALRYEVYTLEQDLLRFRAYATALQSPLMVIATVSQWNDALRRVVEACRGCGVGMLQLRMKDAPDRVCFDAALRVSELLAGSDTTLILNDRADMALAVGAGGVHLGEEDLPLRAARQLMGGGRLVGATAPDPATAKAAVLAGADYLGAGAAFATASKGDAIVRGVDAILSVQAAVDVPVYAIGGITPDNAASLVSAGLRRIAVGAAVTEVGDPAAAIQSLLQALVADTPR